mgnify:FL=1|tara:strand:+ start:1492 stop:1743 length:252 start_codon:yes stop_codon:yes gene_type:complete
MKTLTRNDVSLFIFTDSVPLILDTENTKVGNPLEYIIGDCNSNNSEIHLNVTIPDGWACAKYLFDGVTWSDNPDWFDPDVIPE